MLTAFGIRGMLPLAGVSADRRRPLAGRRRWASRADRGEQASASGGDLA
jgi:hypothetical protein